MAKNSFKKFFKSCKQGAWKVGAWFARLGQLIGSWMSARIFDLLTWWNGHLSRNPEALTVRYYADLNHFRINQKKILKMIRQAAQTGAVKVSSSQIAATEDQLDSLVEWLGELGFDTFTEQYEPCPGQYVLNIQW